MNQTDPPLAIILAEDLYEDLELHYPRLRMLEAEFHVEVAGPKAGATYKSKHGYPVTADVAYSDVDPSRVSILIVPGGYAPDRMRRSADCIELVRNAWDAGAVCGVICHGGWVAISAGIVDGKRATSFFAIRDDMVNAGAQWIDEPTVVDGQLVTARIPADLPEFVQAILCKAEATV